MDMDKDGKRTYPPQPDAAASAGQPPTKSKKVAKVERVCANTGCGQKPQRCCSRCRAVFYCSPECQRKHWKEGGHRKYCVAPAKAAAAAAAAREAATATRLPGWLRGQPTAGPVPNERPNAAAAAAKESAADAAACAGPELECFICLDEDADSWGYPVLHSGCACREDAGFAHPGCIVMNADARGKAEDESDVEIARALQRQGESRQDCSTCKQAFTGRMQLGIATIAWTQVEDDPRHRHGSSLRLNLAIALRESGRCREAIAMLREVLAARQHGLGPEHPATLMVVGQLTQTLTFAGGDEEAHRMLPGLLAVKRRVLGPEHDNTLATAGDLAVSLMNMCRFAESEVMLRDLVAVHTRLHGPEHKSTTVTTCALATVLDRQGRFKEAAKISRELLVLESRVLGPEHPDTLMTRLNLGISLGNDGQYVESTEIMRAALAGMRGVLGKEHPDTQVGESMLREIYRRMQLGLPGVLPGI